MSEAGAHEQRVTAEAHAQLARAVQGSEVQRDRAVRGPAGGVAARRAPLPVCCRSTAGSLRGAVVDLDPAKETGRVRRRAGIWVFWHTGGRRIFAEAARALLAANP